MYRKLTEEMLAFIQTTPTAIYTAAQSAFVDGADPADALAAAAATIEPIVSANPLPDTHQLD